MKPKKGRILILPQVKDKVRAVHELITTVLPELCRHLFPFFEGDRWVHSGEYEHDSVQELKVAQRKVRKEAEAESLHRRMRSRLRRVGSGFFTAS